MNRQVRDPYAWWCERAAVGQSGSPFPTRLSVVFIFFQIKIFRILSIRSKVFHFWQKEFYSLHRKF